METGKKMEVNHILRQFKDEGGIIKYPLVLSIPVSERIPQLAKQDFNRIIKLVIGAVTMAMESINFKRGLNEFQVLDLSEAIIDTASEDNLSFEDLMLFLQKLVRGEYDISYESIDIPKFMKVFELYREERWQKLNEIRMEHHVQHKIGGDAGRMTKSDQLSEHFSSLGERISEMKSRITSLKEENRNLKIDSF